MKRFITYLYEYRNGEKGRNVGFARLDLRDQSVRLLLNLQGRLKDQSGELYLVTESGKEGVVGIPLKKTEKNAQGSTRVFSAEGIEGSPYGIRDIAGTAIRFSSGAYAVSCWNEEPPEELLTGNFILWEPDSADVGISGGNRNGTQPEPAGNKDVFTDEGKNRLEEDGRKQQALPDTAEKIRAQAIHTEEVIKRPSERGGDEPSERGGDEPSERGGDEPLEKSTKPKYSCRRIDIAEIHRLPQRNRYLINNSFLLHGFFNYRYLVLLEREDSDGPASDRQGVRTRRTYLGIPGIFEPAEKAMAVLFGFSGFVPERDTESSVEEEEEPLTGTFGYWSCPVQV